MYIVNGRHTPLLGRDWLYALDILPNNIKQLKTDSDEPTFPLKVEPLIERYSKIFQENIKPVKGYTYEITLQDNAQPRFRKARQIPFSLQTRVEKEIARLEEEGIIEKTDHSTWATPVVPIVKPNGSIRLCADYSRTVNDQMVVPQHPFPGFEEVLEKMKGGKRFSTLDVRTAFLHIPVTPRTSEVLTINTHLGLYKVNRLMFGISSAPAIWQAYIEGVLSGLNGVAVVHDDIIVTGANDEEHLANLRYLFEKLEAQGICLNKEKCKFLQNQVKYLGYILDSEGIRETPEKIQAIIACKSPTNVQEVKSFLGMVTFYGRFLKNLATIASPLYSLLRKNTKFQWSEKEERSFQAIKYEIASDKLLVHYNPQLPLILSADASPYGLGAVLSHFVDGVERPIAFASRVLNVSERNYSQIDREALAIKWAVSKFVHYLYGREFILYTDHQPLTHIFNKKQDLPVITATRLLRYALFLQNFNFIIKYRRSEQNGNADCLSRLPDPHYVEQRINEYSIFHFERWDPDLPDETSLYFLEQINTLPLDHKQLAEETKKDPETSNILMALRFGGSGAFKDHNWSLQGDCIFVGTRVFIPEKFRKQVLDELHLGHIGIVKMKALARSHVYWPGIDRDIERLANNCTSCITTAHSPRKVSTHFWEYPTRPWERIHIDHAGPFMGSIFFVVVDAHSKWIETFTVPSTSASNVIKILESLFARYGIPQTIVSDNAACYTGSEFQSFTKLYHITHKTSAPFHPASNGQAERYVGIFKQALRSLQTYPGTIQQRLNMFLYTYRRAPNVTTGYSPAMLFLGREIRSRLDIMRPDPIKAVTDKLRKNNIVFSDPSFTPGETVAVRSYQNPNHKWAIGRIVAKDGVLHYTVQVKDEMWRRHVEQIRRVGNDVTSESRSTRNVNSPTFTTCRLPVTHTASTRPIVIGESVAQSSLSEETSRNINDNEGTFNPFSVSKDHTSPVKYSGQHPLTPPSPTQREPIQVQTSPPSPDCTVRRSTRQRRAPVRLDL